jgi:hypothetical protein
MIALPPNTPAPVSRTMTEHTRNGYTFVGLAWHPSTGLPLAKMILTGPGWFLVLIGALWLVCYGLARFPLTRNAGTALLAHHVVRQPIIFVDADGATL